MQIRQALQQGLKTLNEHQVPSAPLAAELLLMHALDCDRAHLHAHPERNLSRSLADRYFAGITERASGTPTQYIVGHQEFWGLDFLVDADVLIPRPETEHLIEAVLELIDLEGIVKNGRTRQDTFQMIDIGTGSGCIALALAHELPNADVVACDISPKALRVAERNAARLGLSERVTFMESDLLARFLTTEQIGPWDFIVSNPPYVSSPCGAAEPSGRRTSAPHSLPRPPLRALQDFRRQRPAFLEAKDSEAPRPRRRRRPYRRGESAGAWV